jgi:hypothetical protein
MLIKMLFKVSALHFTLWRNKLARLIPENVSKFNIGKYGRKFDKDFAG